MDEHGYKYYILTYIYYILLLLPLLLLLLLLFFESRTIRARYLPISSRVAPSVEQPPGSTRHQSHLRLGRGMGLHKTRSGWSPFTPGVGWFAAFDVLPPKI